MDEAERCHRIAILDTGRLVADGTPVELTHELIGRTVGVRTAEPRKAQAALHEAQGVISVAQIGNELRVLTAAGEHTESRLADFLRSRNIEAEVMPIDPNLEDVFVFATHSEQKKARAA
jgi:ABC-2 type transport system ATP-binding protein